MRIASAGQHRHHRLTSVYGPAAHTSFLLREQRIADALDAAHDRFTATPPAPRLVKCLATHASGARLTKAVR